MGRRVQIRWVYGNEPDLENRSIDLYEIGEETGLPMPVSSVPIPDQEFVCDICNDLIVHRPFPIVGSYALCQIHQEKWGIRDGQAFYEEAD